MSHTRRFLPSWIAVFFVFAALVSQADEPPAPLAIQPFTPHPCTDFFNGTLNRPDLWEHCCTQHDLYYWAGGSNAAREAADRELGSCVAATGEPVVGWIMHLGVRLGSLSPIKYKSREWGNAWTDQRGTYKSLTLSDVDLIAEEIASQDLAVVTPEMLDDFLATLRTETN